MFDKDLTGTRLIHPRAKQSGSGKKDTRFMSFNEVLPEERDEDIRCESEKKNRLCVSGWLSTNTEYRK